MSNEICAEGKKLGDDGHSTSFKSPRKSYKRIKYATNLDDFDNEVVRRTVHSFYDNHKFPTSSKILAAMREKTNYPGSKSSIKVLLKNLDFKYKNCNDGHKFLMERNDIVASRVKFLRKMNAFRCNNDSRPVVYLDETWVNQNHTRGRWSTIARVLPFWVYDCARCRNNKEHAFDYSKAYNCA